MTVLLVLVYPVLMVIREKMVQLYPVLLALRALRGLLEWWVHPASMGKMAILP
jgi:hypothetical protein